MGKGGDGKNVAVKHAEQEPHAIDAKYQQYLLPNLDAAAFREDLLKAKEAVGEATADDAAHMLRLVTVVNLLSVVGPLVLFVTVSFRHIYGGESLLLAALGCIVSGLCISTARCMAWTIVGHHTMHGGFSDLAKSGEMTPRWRRGTFAIGAWRRIVDWLDWMLPEAWNLEHNKLHHYQLSEEGDPDVVEANFQTLREMPLPVFVKMAVMGFFMLTWKYTYYSTNTLKQLLMSEKDTWMVRNWPQAEPKAAPLVAMRFPVAILSSLRSGNLKDALFWLVFSLRWLLLISPMLLSVFAPPALLLASDLAGLWPASSAGSAADAARLALAVCVLAECLTNAHSFIIIACNHAGDDLWRFSSPCKPYGAEFFLRCAYAGVNFETGTEVVDVLYGWLNYQIEHHMFPDMTPLQYRKLQPLVKEVCRKHKVLYIQENALWRTWKTCMVATGGASMGRCEAVLPPTTEDPKTK